MKKIAEDNYAINRAYDYFIENINMEDIVEIAARLHISWEDANATGFIEEQYDSFNDWMKDYGKSIASDSISKLKNNDEQFNFVFSNIAYEDREEFNDKIFEYLLSISDKIESEINDAR